MLAYIITSAGMTNFPPEIIPLPTLMRHKIIIDIFSVYIVKYYVILYFYHLISNFGVSHDIKCYYLRRLLFNDVPFQEI